MKVREISPARKGGLMYLNIHFVEELLASMDDVIPDKVWKKHKKMATLVDTLRECVKTHREDIRTGRGIVIGRDIQEVRYVTQVVAKKDKPEKAKPKRKRTGKRSNGRH